MSGRTFAAAGVALALGTHAGAASANSRYPIAGQIAFSPSQPDLVALRTTFGVLVSGDGGRNWSWICEPAVGYADVNQDPSIGWTAGAALVGMFEGLAVSPDEGCSWSTKIPTSIGDVVVRRDDPRGAFALTSAYQGTDDAGDLRYTSTIVATADDGATWAPFGTPIDPLVFPETIDVSADGTSIYVSGETFLPGNGRQGVFLRSTDQGVHYAKSTIALEPLEAAPFIAAIDPTNPLRVYVRTSSAAPAGSSGAPTGACRLLVSDDGGQSFRTVLTSAGPLLGFALSPDGTKVYAGGPDDGVQVADSATLSFAKRSSLPVQCLGASKAGLFACSDDAVAFLLGVSTDDGATFSPVLRRRCVRGALACPAGTSTAQCGPLVAGLAQLGVGTGGPGCDGALDAAADGAPGDAPANGDSAPPAEVSPPTRATCNCRTAPGLGAGRGEWALAAIAAAFAGGRAIRRRSRPRPAPTSTDTSRASTPASSTARRSASTGHGR